MYCYERANGSRKARSIGKYQKDDYCQEILLIECKNIQNRSKVANICAALLRQDDNLLSIENNRAKARTGSETSILQLHLLCCWVV